ncbi:Uncharacterized protein TCM_025644 [Theobroma cacao]|uniref:Uncharacterized protein n=1 Tax=Theobroma cacao TaxID=3641 RepID=A0A061F706_THECC|nr:Uncharacterized protein TCM_025644 [Theobroma cacao]
MEPCGQHRGNYSFAFLNRGYTNLPLNPMFKCRIEIVNSLPFTEGIIGVALLVQ